MERPPASVSTAAEARSPRGASFPHLQRASGRPRAGGRETRAAEDRAVRGNQSRVAGAHLQTAAAAAPVAARRKLWAERGASAGNALLPRGAPAAAVPPSARLLSPTASLARTVPAEGEGWGREGEGGREGGRGGEESLPYQTARTGEAGKLTSAGRA